MRLTTFGEVTLPPYNADHQFENSAQTGLMDLDGSTYDVWGDASVHAPRALSATFEIWETDTETVDEQLDTLLTEFGKGRLPLRAVTRDAETRKTWAKVSAISYSRRKREIGYQAVSVTFELDYPFWINDDDEPMHFNDGYIFDGSWTFLDGNVEVEAITSSPHAFSIDNTGGVVLKRGYIRFSLDGTDAITNPRITNSTNGQWVQYTGSLATGDSLEFDLLAMVVWKNGTIVNDDISISDAQSWLMELDLGSNSISITGSSIVGSIDFQWQWSRHYA